MKREKEKDKQFSGYIYGYTNINQYKTDVAFKTLIEGVKANMYIIPDFQRVYKWSEDQVENLAISLMRGMPIPPIYTYRNEMNQLEILDGQQRVISMVLYYMGKYMKRTRKSFINLKTTDDDKESLFDCLEKTGLKDKTYEMKYYDFIDGKEVAKKIDITYESLPLNIKRKVDYTNITVIEINIEKKELSHRYLYKIFANLNSGAEPLTPQELRNSIYTCKFYKMLYEVNEYNKRWHQLFGRGAEISANIERLLLFCAYKYYVKFADNKFTIDNYTNMNKLLNDFSEEAVNFSEQIIEEYKSDIEEFISLLKGKISKRLLKEPLLGILFAVINKADYKIDITEEFYKKVKSNEKYQQEVENGDSKSSIENKLKAVYDELYGYIN